MSAMSLILNVLWIAFGGLWMALGWILAAAVMVITIIGIPWARAALTIASYTFLPFGRRIVDRPVSILPGMLSLIGNVIWLLLAGWWLALGHLITAVGLAITIIGLPFAWAHLKLAGVSLWPVGKDVVAA
ncbi:MAG TPA: YccF domain-containing protein [Hyphomicrobiaceae bacterium]|nr:YccF domain-containing protein [Hyphomicrobiaceae bacterium]